MRSFSAWSDKKLMNSALVFERAVVKRIATLAMPMIRNARINFDEIERIKIIPS
jgi:hypothetical protein